MPFERPACNYVEREWSRCVSQFTAAVLIGRGRFFLVTRAAINRDLSPNKGGGGEGGGRGGGTHFVESCDLECQQDRKVTDLHVGPSRRQCFYFFSGRTERS